MRQTLIESALLALASAHRRPAGQRSSRLRAWLRLVPGGLPRTGGIAIGGAAIAFTVALAVAGRRRHRPRAGTVAGARRSRRRACATDAARRPPPAAVAACWSSPRSRWRSWSVAAAALLSRSLLKLQSAGERLASDRLLLASLALPQAKYPEPAQQARFMTRLVERLEVTPGVAAATPVNATPFSGLGWDAPTYTAEGQPPENARTNPMLNLEEIHPDYFRTFDAADRPRPRVHRRRPRRARRSSPSSARTSPAAPGRARIRSASGSRWATPARKSRGGRWSAWPRARRYPRAARAAPVALRPGGPVLGAARDVAVRTSAPVAAVAAPVRAQVAAIDGDVQRAADSAVRRAAGGAAGAPALQRAAASPCSRPRR